MAAVVASLLPPVAAWFVPVNTTVQEPYLDEFFHVRQAQHYCQGNFEIWDPKITTPPGLYLLSYLFSPVLGCSITSLRLIGAICLVALLLMLRASYGARRRSSGQSGALAGALASHTCLNIVLFPPLFFFSALYYTDVASTLSVMVVYWHFLKTLPNKRRTFFQGAIQILLGAITLMFRQTNIFWVAIAPAAWTLISELDKGHRVVKESMCRRAQGFGDTTLSIAKTSWKMEVIYAPPVGDAYLEDYFCTIISIAICAIKALTQPKRILDIIQALFPYLTLIAIFATFILWNGSVVLGDKSNHVATMNLPQMLYLWPFIAFFSWPLLLPQLFLFPLTAVSQGARVFGVKPLIPTHNLTSIPRIWLLCAFTLLAGVVIQLNTIVHPFTLADNRHYVFYIFKRLLRPWWMRYLAAPIYVLAGWASIASLDGKSEPSTDQKALQHDSPPRSSNHPVQRAEANSSTAVLIVYLATTALSLCTAPLVEPRYCIIPWIAWRMQHSTTESSREDRKELSKSILGGYDSRLILETIWFLLVNAATGYIFLTWSFEWPSEPGRAQRFMW